jgi:hypothetical protein
VIAHFKASGDGWQTRIDAALRQFIAEHPGSRLIERAVGPGSAQPPGLP